MNLRRLVTIVVACLAVAGLGFVLFELGLALVTPQHGGVLITAPPS